MLERKAYLFALDFDGTAADTFQPSPNGIGVKEAYAHAIHDIFGDKGREVYESIGRLQNRAPCELVDVMIKKEPSLSDPAFTFFEKNRERLNSMMPLGKGVALNAESVNQNTIAELLVRQKLSYLLDQIGTSFPDGSRWPKPCNGFTEFWDQLQILNNDLKGELTTAIISSGHGEFIRKTFDLWGLNPPDILISEDDIRGRKFPIEMERRVKPGEFSMALAHREYLHREKLWPPDNPDAVIESRNRMIYFGDDPVKDGKLAEGANILFGWFNPNHKSGATPEGITFDNWQTVADLLSQHKGLMKEGRTFREILSQSTTGIEGFGLKDKERKQT